MNLIAKLPGRAVLSTALFIAGITTGAVGYRAMKAGVISDVTLVAIIAGLTVLTAPLGWVLWFRLDEAAREAHKSAWMHGGSIGTLLGSLIVVALVASEAKLGWSPGLEELASAQAMAVGAGLLLIMQILGYGLVWAGWWLSKR